MAGMRYSNLINMEGRIGYVYENSGNYMRSITEILDIEIMKILDVRLDIEYHTINGPCLWIYRCCNCAVNNSLYYQGKEHPCTLWPEYNFNQLRKKSNIYHYYKIVSRKDYNDDLLSIEISEMPNLIKINEARFNDWVINPIIFEQYDIEEKKKEFEKLYEYLNIIDEKITCIDGKRSREGPRGCDGRGNHHHDDDDDNSAKSTDSEDDSPKYRKLKNKFNDLNQKYEDLVRVVKELSKVDKGAKVVKGGEPGSADPPVLPVLPVSIVDDIAMRILLSRKLEELVEIKNEIIDEIDKFITPISINWLKYVLTCNKKIITAVKNCDIDSELTAIRNKVLEFDLIFNEILEYLANDEEFKNISYISRNMTPALFLGIKSIIIPTNKLILRKDIPWNIRYLPEHPNYEPLVNMQDLNSVYVNMFEKNYYDTVKDYIKTIVDRFLHLDKIEELRIVEIEVVTSIKNKLTEIIEPYIRKSHWQGIPDSHCYKDAKTIRSNIYYNKIFTPLEDSNNIGIADAIRNIFINNITAKILRRKDCMEPDVEFTLVDGNIVCTQL